MRHGGDCKEHEGTLPCLLCSYPHDVTTRTILTCPTFVRVSP
jgi:hypothetical protein